MESEIDDINLTDEQIDDAVIAYNRALDCYKWLLHDIAASELCCDGDRHLIPLHFRQDSLFREYYAEYCTLNLDLLGLESHQLLYPYFELLPTTGIKSLPLNLWKPEYTYVFAVTDEARKGLLPSTEGMIGILPSLIDDYECNWGLGIPAGYSLSNLIAFRRDNINGWAKIAHSIAEYRLAPLRIILDLSIILPKYNLLRGMEMPDGTIMPNVFAEMGRLGCGSGIDGSRQAKASLPEYNDIRYLLDEALWDCALDEPCDEMKEKEGPVVLSTKEQSDEKTINRDCAASAPNESAINAEIPTPTVMWAQDSEIGRIRQEHETERPSPAPEPPPKEQNDANDTEQDILSDGIPQQITESKTTTWDTQSEVTAKVKQYAATNANIFIFGDPGTGKTFLAKQIHEASGRNGKFTDSNCSIYQGGNLQNELFGHSKGAFTGADSNRSGKVKTAKGGTIFLDEIGDCDLNCRAMMLSFLQDKKIEPLGGDETEIIDVRIIAATNKSEAIFQEERNDFFQRFPVIIRLAPINERRDEIPSLIRPLFNKMIREANKKSLRLRKNDEQAIGNKLAGLSYSFPKNIRSIEEILFTAISNRIIRKSKNDDPDAINFTLNDLLPYLPI